MRVPFVRHLLTRARLWRCASVGEGVQVLGHVWIHGGGEVHLGPGVVLDGRQAPIELHAERGAHIRLEEGVRVEGGASIEAVQSVVVGPNAVLRGFAKVLDNHFHPVEGNRHERPTSEPVRIGEKAQLGPRSIVLPGADIGRGATLGPGVVIGRRVPDGATLVGAPPRSVRLPVPNAGPPP